MGEKAQDKPAHVSGQSNTPISAPAHALTYEQVVEELKGDSTDGLSSDEAKRRLEEYGRNEFGDDKGVQPLRIFIAQIANALTFVSFFHLSRSPLPLSLSISLLPSFSLCLSCGGNSPSVL
jgi:Na+-exporting ATPase